MARNSRPVNATARTNKARIFASIRASLTDPIFASSVSILPQSSPRIVSILASSSSRNMSTFPSTFSTLAIRSWVPQWPTDCRDSPWQSLTPVARSSGVVREGDHDCLCRSLRHHDIERKSSQTEALCVDATRARSKGNNSLFEKVERYVNGALKLLAEPLALRFVPSSGFDGLVHRCFVNEDLSGQGLRRRLRMRFENSPRSTRLAVPASISPRRREISASHSVLAPSSGGPSRLATRSC